MENRESTPVFALVATIPTRLRSCERLCAELSRQSRPPDGVVLVLDGYGEEQRPGCSLPVVAEYRTAKPCGPGARWRVAEELGDDVILVNLDDDITLLEAPNLVGALLAALKAGGGAAAAMGRTFDGKLAPPGSHGRGDLLYAAGCGLAVCAGQLKGLRALSDEVCAAGGTDPLGPLGDDDALVSAHLWKRRVKIVHAATGNIYAAPGTRASSQGRARELNREGLDVQKKLIAKVTGWPWPSKP